MSWLSVPASIAAVLRPYQREQIERNAAALARYKRICNQDPTGAGKTHNIAAIVAAASAAGMAVLILATRTRLVRQIHDRLDAFGVEHGVIAAGLGDLRWWSSRVQVSSADTLYRRAIVDKRMPLPSADLIIFDECHLAVADSRKALIDHYPDALLIGFTATPARKGGRALGPMFETLDCGPSIGELIGAGMLVRPKIFNVPVVSNQDLKSLPKDASNDYAAKSLGELLSRPKLIGDVVGNWMRIASTRRTLVFAVTKAHAAQLQQQFLQAGVVAELLLDSDDETTREATVARLETGATSVIVNCFLMSYGVDIPSVDCIVLARPTRSVVMYLQMVGRGMRVAPGKSHFLLIDHGRVVESLGLPHIDRAWSLDSARNINTDTRAQFGRKAAIERPRTCPECSHMWMVAEDGAACRHCGWRPVPRARGVTTVAADLTELVEDEAAVSPHDGRCEYFFAQALHWYSRRWPDRWRERPKSARWWSWLKTAERFRFTEGTRIPSRFWDTQPVHPSSEVSAWISSRHIRDIKRRQVAA